MQISNSIIYFCTAILLFGCGGGSTPPPPKIFNFSVNSSQPSVNEGEQAVYDLSYIDASGAVKITASIKGNKLINQNFTLTTDDNNKQVILNIVEVNQNIDVVVQITATDGKNKSVIKKVNLSVINTSAIAKLDKLTNLRVDSVDAENIKEEVRLLHLLANIAHINQNINSQQKNDYLKMGSDLVNPSKIVTLNEQLTTFKDIDKTSKEEDIDKANTTLITSLTDIKIEPNVVINELLVTLNGFFPDTLVGEYFYDPTTGGVSQFWKNPKLGNNVTLTNGEVQWQFKPDYTILNEIINPTLTCNITK